MKIERLAAAMRAARFAVAGLLGLLLAGCMIVSKTPLVADSEATDVLPATFYVFGYDDSETARKRGEDPPMAFTRTGHTYAAADGSMNLLFAPVEGASDTYLLSVGSPDGTIYGVARYRDAILAIDIVLRDEDPGEAIAAEKAAGATALDALVIEDGGITVETRAALDALIRMHRDGKLPMDTLVAWIGDSAEAPAPARIAPDGDFWKAAE